MDNTFFKTVYPIPLLSQFDTLVTRTHETLFSVSPSVSVPPFGYLSRFKSDLDAVKEKMVYSMSISRLVGWFIL